MIWIISGPSNAGKSTFIQNGSAQMITRSPEEPRTIFPFDENIELLLSSNKDSYLHYNILRAHFNATPLHRKILPLFFSTDKKIKQFEISVNYTDDAPWKTITQLKAEKKAIVLVAGKKTLIGRAKQREDVEIEEFKILKQNGYKSMYWSKLIEKMDIEIIYQSWLSELFDKNIPYILVDSTNSNYEIIHGMEKMLSLISES